MVYDTLPSQDAPIHQILDSYLQLCRRYAPDTIILEIRSTVKVTVTPKWYETLSYSKMHPHTKFEMLISNNIGDIARTRKRN